MKRYFVIIIGFVILNCAGMKKASEFYQNKDYYLAIEECQQAIAQDSLNAEAYLIMGKSYKALGKIDEAMNSLVTAFKIQPNSPVTVEAKDELIALKLDRADALLGKEKFSQAISEYEDILDLDSTNVDAYVKLGDYYKRNRYLDKADSYYQKAGRLDSVSSFIATAIHSIDSLNQVAKVNFQRGKKNYLNNHNKTAAKYLKLALKHKADHREARYYHHMAQGKILYKKRSKSNCWDAIAHYGKAMMIRPGAAEPHFFMAQAYEKKDRNEFDNAIEEYTIALEKESKGPYAVKSRKKIKALKTRRDKLKKFWGK